MNEERLREAVLAVAPAAGGDWTDVLARASRTARARRRRRAISAAVAFALLLLTAGTTLAVGERFFHWFSVEPSTEQAPTLPGAAPYVAGATFYRAGADPQRLSHPLLAPLLGQDAPLAVLSPDGRRLAYHSARHTGGATTVPLLYVHDIKTGRDRLLARGAQTVAWNRDGRLAYFQAARARYDGRRGAYVGHVVVRTLSGPPARWTRTAGTYEVLAWARDALLVALPRCLLENCGPDLPPGVYVLERSGALRPLGLTSLASLSPDGRYAFGRHDLFPGDDAPSALVRLVEVATGRPVATLDLTQAVRRAGLGGLLPGSIVTGAWRGDDVVVSFGGLHSALVFLTVRGGRLRVDSVARIPPQALRTRYGVAFGAPFFTGEDAVVVPIRGERPDGRYVVAVVACSRRTNRCLRGAVLPGRRWFAIADNRSRPAP